MELHYAPLARARYRQKRGPLFDQLFKPAKEAMKGMPHLTSGCNRSLQMSAEDEIKALVCYLEKHIRNVERETLNVERETEILKLCHLAFNVIPPNPICSCKDHIVNPMRN